MTTLELGTLNITDRRLANFIESSNLNINEIKLLIVDFLKEKLLTQKEDMVIEKKGKWADFAERMSGLTDADITAHIAQNHKEMKESFEFRNLKLD